MKIYGGVDIKIHRPCDLGIRWRWVTSFALRPFYPRCPLDKSWVGSRTGKGGELWKRETLDSARNRTQAVFPVARRYADCTIPIPNLSGVPKKK
jgi:hypothetical protein